jgi:hypothetical protein
MTDSENRGSTTPATASLIPTEVAEVEKSGGFDDQLASIPEKYREEILRQYALPQTKVGIFSILRWATRFEATVMMIGTLAAIAAGNPLLSYLSKTRCCAPFDHRDHRQPHKRFWRFRCRRGAKHSDDNFGKHIQ